MLLPQFNIKTEEILEKLKQLLHSQQIALENFLTQNPQPTFSVLVEYLAQLDNALHHFWSPISHLHAVASTPALRTVYQTCLPLLTAHYTYLGQHERLYHAYRQIKESVDFAQLTPAEQRLIELRLRDFHLAGVDLPADKKQQFAEMEQQLAVCSSQFGEHVLDATQKWYTLINDEAELIGLPAHTLAHAKALAEKHQQGGWRLTLDYPCYRAIQQYAQKRELREKFYYAYVTRASELGVNTLDNTPIMQQILILRQKLAQLLGYSNYAQLSLTTKMAQTPEEVLDFLHKLAHQAKPAAQQELAELTEFAGHPLLPWDIAYYSEKLRQQRYAINEEQLRQYFSLENVLAQLFQLVEKLFGLTIQLMPEVVAWHEDVRCYRIIRDQKVCGIFYLDLYVRDQKRGGAWMDDYCSRLKLAESQWQIPVAFLTCNFAAPHSSAPALLTHDDVITLFHEFGHGLHHLLTTIDYLDINGIHNVPWDAVEFPSQFLENWCWSKEMLLNLARHYQTHAPLPEKQLQALLDSRHFHAGLQLVRQLEFALFDFYLHLSPPTINSIHQALEKSRALVAAYAVPDYYRMPHTFTHIFDGGYAAGYYSYLWAEVLAADAFEAFSEQGIFNSTLGQRFLNTLLSQGGSQPPAQLFKAFRGRNPDPEALLRAWGLTTPKLFV